MPQQPTQLVYGRGGGGGGGGVGGGLGLRVVAPDQLLRELVGAALYVDEKRRETEIDGQGGTCAYVALRTVHVLWPSTAVCV